MAVMRIAPEGPRLVRRIETADWFTTDVASAISRCRTALFVDSDAAFVAETCAAIARAESEASTPEGCQGGLNIEGAVALPDGRVWLGLRSPLVEGSAVMLRLVDSLVDVAALRFDAVALVPLKDRGVRSLTMDADRVYGIAGPVADGDEGFALWSTPVGAIVPGSWLGVTQGAELPGSSEGLVLDGDRVVVVIDGAEGATNTACRQESRQLTVTVGS